MVKKKTDESKYVQIIQIKNKNTPIIIPLLLFIKADSTDNELYYMLTFLFRFMGLLIMSGNFNLDVSLPRDHLSISILFRVFTSYGIAERLKITNLVYIILSFLIFFLAIFFGLFYYKTIRTIKKKIQLTKISTYKFQILLDHIAFLLFPFIIEFLSFIYYMKLFGNNYIIKQTMPSYLNNIVLIINFFSLIAYNIQSYFHILSVNDPVSECKTRVKLRYGANKILILSLVQNIVIIESLVLYLSDKVLKIYKSLSDAVILIFFIGLFFQSKNTYNYKTRTNYLLSMLSIFCFFSILLEMLSYFVGYKIDSYMTLVSYTLCKIITSFCFSYVNNTLFERKMINKLEEDLFKIYNSNSSLNEINFDVLLFLFEILKKIASQKENGSDGQTKNIVNVIVLHKSKCNKNDCKCKYIRMFPRGKKYSKKYIQSFLERIFFLFESTFVEVDYLNNYELALIMAEHYYYYKKNPVFAYSMLQTTLFFHTKSLEMNQILVLFSGLHKYINKCNNPLDYSGDQHGIGIEKIYLQEKQAKIYKTIYFNYKYLIKVKRVLKKYASDYLELLKFKENMEETVQINKDENNEIIKISSYYLSTKNLTNIINILLGEIDMNNDLISYLQLLDSNIIPISLIYKCFLFAELFLCGKIPNEIMTLMYSFSNERNLYTQKIQPDTLIKIKKAYKNSIKNNYYYVILKFSDGMNMYFIDEELSKKLNFLQSDLLGYNINKIMPKDFQVPHDHACIDYLINEKHRIFNNLESFFFDKDMHMHYCTFDGICMPGLGKYLICVLKFFFKENKYRYYFYLNKNLECLSLSGNFADNYNISLNIINKFKISLLELIDVKKEDLEFLKDDIEKINQYKALLELKTNTLYSNKLFKEKLKHHSGQNNFQFLKIIKNSEAKDNMLIDENSSLKSANETQIDNLEKFLFDHHNHDYSIDEIEKHTKLIIRNRSKIMDKINEVISRNNEMDRNNKDYNLLTSVSTKFFGASSIKEQCKEKFYIKYGIKIVYNSYFYLFKIDEIFQQNSPLIKLSTTDTKKNKIVKVLSRGDTKNSTININVKDIKNSKDFQQKNGDESSSNKENKNSNKSSIIVINKVKLFDYINFMVIVILGSLFITFIIILFYQRNMVKSNHKSFLIYYYNYYQRDMLNELFSIMLSTYFHYLNITNYTDIMNESDFIDLLSTNSYQFQDSFHHFYDVYVTYKTQENHPINKIFEKKSCYKITSNFENDIVQIDYVDNAEYVALMSKYSSFSDKINNIIEDSEYLFLGNFLKFPEQKTKTCFIQIFYFLCKNYYTIFYKIFNEIEEEVTLEFQQLSFKSKYTYVIIELVSFIILSAFFIIVLFFLHQTNQAIFRNILNMYINCTQDDNFNYKNRKDNLTLIKIISHFIVLINDFNSENLSKLYSIINGNNNLTFTNIGGRASNINEAEIAKLFHDRRDSTNDKINGTNVSGSQASLINNDNLSSLNILNMQKSKNMEKQQSFHHHQKNKIVKKLSLDNKIYQNKIVEKSKMQKTTPNENQIEDTEKMSASLFVKKMENKGIKDIKISCFALLLLFLIEVVYFFVKIFISLDFITEIKGIFEDFGVLASRYSLIYHYFNSLRTFIIIPQFYNEEIFLDSDQIVELRNIKMENVINFKLTKYPTVNKFYNSILNVKIEKGNEYEISFICNDDIKCKTIIESSKYNLFSGGLSIAVSSTLRQIINYYKDYQNSIKNVTNINDIKKYFIDKEYEQIDMNLNYVFYGVEKRIYEVFMTDLNSLVNKYNSIIEALNICAVIYCCIVAFTVMAFIIGYLRRITIRIEEATVRINNSFCYMVMRNKSKEEPISAKVSFN